MKCPDCGNTNENEIYDADCEYCDGFGEVEESGEWIVCPDCDGDGTEWDTVECGKCGCIWSIE